jgi:hypothetical protein
MPKKGANIFIIRGFIAELEKDETTDRSARAAQ